MGERQMSTSSCGRRYEDRADARDGRAFWRGARGGVARTQRRDAMRNQRDRKREREKRGQRAAREERGRVKRVKTKGVAKQEKETRQRYRRF